MNVSQSPVFVIEISHDGRTRGESRNMQASRLALEALAAIPSPEAGEG
jgi:hypothetical protein